MPPRVFLSYAHESPEHSAWVLRLASDLVRNRVEVLLDQWTLRAGDDLGVFMDRAVRDADYVALICTDAFGQRANARDGGLGYEQAVLVGELLVDPRAGSRYLPLLRSGAPSRALPHYLRSRLFVDFRDDADYDRALEQLVRRVYGAPELVPPQLGPMPAFLDSGTREASGVAGAGDRAAPAGDAAPAVAHLDAAVLVAGTGARWRDPGDKARATAVALGERLARAGYGLVTGGWPGVDEAAARAYARELARAGPPLEDRLTQVIVDDRLPAFPAGNLVLVKRGREEWTESVRRADVVVLIGGVGGTATTGEYGLRYGRVVLPLADTGGDAAKFYLRMLRAWSKAFVPGVDRAQFQKIAREAPGVVDAVIEVLEAWRSARGG